MILGVVRQYLLASSTLMQQLRILLDAARLVTLRARAFVAVDRRIRLNIEHDRLIA